MPNLPTGLVSMAAVGAKYIEIINALEKMGIGVVTVPENKDVSQQLAFHADLSLLHAGGNTVFVSRSNPLLSEMLADAGFDVHFAISCNSCYPNDIPTNACVVGDYLLCHNTGTDPSIIRYFTLNNSNIMYLNQGYVKCSVCPIRHNAVITTDAGIERSLRTSGFDVLLVDARSIILDGYNEGFIGGAAVMLDRNTLALTGRLYEHSLVKSFCSNYGIDVVCLTNDICTDVGSIIPLTEKIRYNKLRKLKNG